jgi:hypothetical protein
MRSAAAAFALARQILYLRNRSSSLSIKLPRSLVTLICHVRLTSVIILRCPTSRQSIASVLCCTKTTSFPRIRWLGTEPPCLLPISSHQALLCFCRHARVNKSRFHVCLHSFRPGRRGSIAITRKALTTTCMIIKPGKHNVRNDPRIVANQMDMLDGFKAKPP